jgi:glycosyltransferase involved in cell wall biosynthesis
MIQFSVITINFNNASGLEKTIQSVINQTSKNFEYIIIDGGSTDESNEIINNHSNNITYFISEKDKGIYDAQNKGIKIAKGNFLIFLNSGDCFADSNVLKDVEQFNSGKQVKLIYGNTNLINKDDSITKLIPPDTLNLNFWYMNTLNHQAVFAHKSLFNEIGNFSMNYRFASDFEFIFKAYRKYPNDFIHADLTVCIYDNSGLTSNVETEDFIIAEREQILKANTSRKEFYAMRSAYFKTVSLKKKYSFYLRQNIFLKNTVKPIYDFLKKIIR